jgi:shikimate dehydrogenase
MIKGLLIGNPIDKSISHITHNQIFNQIGVLGKYEKRSISLENLEEEICILKDLDYNFLAVTMPLKEKIIPFLDEVRSETDSVNTIKIERGRWIGYNFDGTACLNAIERVINVKGKRVLVIGAGGAAKSVIHEAMKRGAEVFVWNRTYERALEISKKWPVSALREIKESFDVIIQATSVGMFLEEPPIDMNIVTFETVVMEIVYNPMITKFVSESLKRDANVVFGYEMFAELTYEQFNLVLENQPPKDIFLKTIKNFFIKN